MRAIKRVKNAPKELAKLKKILPTPEALENMTDIVSRTFKI